MHRYSKAQQKRKAMLSFSAAIQSFLGYLEGTQKSAHTIKSYRLDLLSFKNFLLKNTTKPLFNLKEISRQHLIEYQNSFIEKGLKTNTRRRKMLTLTQFFSYLIKRKKIDAEIGKKIFTPYKIERIPFTLSSTELEKLIYFIKKLPHESIFDARNRALLWILSETGCLVSEITGLRFEHITNNKNSGIIQFGDGSTDRPFRSLFISNDLYATIESLKQKMLAESKTKIHVQNCSWIFFGFNKFGSLGTPITARGIELLVKHFSRQKDFLSLTPRTIRHSVAVHWLSQGYSSSEVQSRLGLKTNYAIRTYELIFKSNCETTSNAEKTPLEF